MYTVFTQSYTALLLPPLQLLPASRYLTLHHHVYVYVYTQVLVDKGMTYDKIVPLSQDAIKKAKDAEKLAKQQAAASTTTSKSKWAQQKYSGTLQLLLLLFVVLL
jgi:hypothetical protein